MTYIHQLSSDTWRSPEDLVGVMDDRTDGKKESRNSVQSAWFDDDATADDDDYMYVSTCRYIFVYVSVYVRTHF